MPLCKVAFCFAPCGHGGSRQNFLGVSVLEFTAANFNRGALNAVKQVGREGFAMCGLFALVNPHGVTERDEGWAADALRHMYRRGPDSQVIFQTPDDRCVMAHSRLAILDPRSAADQPMVHPGTGASIVYNGEIYNFPELRRALVARGERFQTHCDTEVVLRLYVLDGLVGLQGLRGMYAFAIWDPRDQSLVVCRDSFGIKPLYMWKDAGRTVVASQVKALAAGLAKVEGNPD